MYVYPARQVVLEPLVIPKVMLHKVQLSVDLQTMWTGITTTIV